MAKYLSRRVKKTPQVAITSDRYQFLGLSQAEPDLGDPIVGPSSVSANPIPGSGVQYLLISYGGDSGKRYWVPSDRLQNSGLIPGSFTVLNNGNQIGLANSFNKFNFVGVAVTVDPVGSSPEEQTGIATVRIEVIDVVAPGNPYEIPYHDPVSGYLRGSDKFVYYNNNVGIGSTLPTEKLEIIGNLIVSDNINSGGIVTAVDINSESLTTNDINATGIATIAQAKIGVGETLVTVTQSGKVGIGSTNPQTLLDVSGDVKLNGAIRLSNGTGTVGQIIISNGSSPAEWSDFNETAVGVANSIPITNTNDPGIYYPTFTKEYDQTASVYVDATSLVYDPSTNRLGIGSILPQYSLDVVGDGQFTGNITANEYYGLFSGQINNTVPIAYAANSGVSTYAINAGIATYSATSGISTSVIGGISSVSSLYVSGISTLGLVKITQTGIITSINPGINEIYYYGDGSNLKNLPSVTTISVNSTGNTSSPIYPTLVSGVGVNSVGISTNKLVFIESTSRFGIGTAIPESNLHVIDELLVAKSGAATTEKIYQRVYNLDKTELSWESTEGKLFSITNNLSEGIIHSINDVNGTTLFDVNFDGTILLNPYKNANVGIATSQPTSTLHVNGSGYFTGIVTANSFSSSSDLRLKTNIKTIENPIEKLVEINGVTFNWIKDGSPSIGVIADDVEQVLPELVDSSYPKSVNYNGLIGLLIECVKTQQNEINSLKQHLSLE